MDKISRRILADNIIRMIDKSGGPIRGKVLSDLIKAANDK